MARILIIDDEIDVRAVMAKVLERAGHEVEVAEIRRRRLACLRDATGPTSSSPTSSCRG